jgi:hypothetical protein
MENKNKKLGSLLLIGSGAVLLIEHLYSYGGLDLFDFWGHEWAGFILILAGILANLRIQK